jgi:hypothetical protein
VPGVKELRLCADSAVRLRHKICYSIACTRHVISNSIKIKSFVCTFSLDFVFPMACQIRLMSGGELTSLKRTCASVYATQKNNE